MNRRTYIAEQVDDALDSAYLAHIMEGRDFGAVNWGDLQCTHVDRTGDGWVVYIEEAAPECEALRLHVLAWLEKQGVNNVSVVTQW